MSGLKYPWVFIPILLVALVFLSGCAHNGLGKAERLAVRRAENLLLDGKPRRARKEMARAVEISASKVETYLAAIESSIAAIPASGMHASRLAADLAGELLMLSDQNKLNRKLTKAEIKGVLMLYARLSYELQRDSEAFRAFERAARLWPKDAAIANDLGYLYAEAGANLNRALDLTQLAVKAEPNNGMYVDSLGWAYYKLGLHSQAVRQLQRAVRLEPADDELRYHLGMAYLRLGRRTQSEIEFRKALACNPYHAGARERLRRLRPKSKPFTPKA